MESLKDAINHPTYPIGMRMRAAYFLRQVHKDHPDDGALQQVVIDTLARGLVNKDHGSLMRHEFAYVMGQLRDERCCPALEEALCQTSDCVMVRHEAAEALGAIGAKRSRPVLDSLVNGSRETPMELVETCRLALNVMEWREGGEDPDSIPAACACMLNPYSSVDPAPPDPQHETMEFSELGDILCDPAKPMFERYRAMFSLRNRGGELAVAQLCRALVKDQSSALFRHEVAYVLGQLQHPDSVEALEESLRRTDEHMMVRHESAEALGAIDGRWEDVEAILKEFTTDECDVVRESCLVALDAADYWGHNQSLADDLTDESIIAPAEDKIATSFAHQKADNRLVLNGHFNVKDTNQQ